MLLGDSVGKILLLTYTYIPIFEKDYLISFKYRRSEGQEREAF